MIVYCFKYNDCIYESAPETLSIHKSEEGANKALDEHKAKAKIEWEQIYPTKEDQTDCPFGEFASWQVTQSELLD